MAHIYAKRLVVASYDAEQMPVLRENEAAKDYEQRISKFCQWLDEKEFEVVDIQLVPTACVVIRDDSGSESKLESGMWVVTMPPLNKGYYVETDESFNQSFIEVLGA